MALRHRLKLLAAVFLVLPGTADVQAYTIRACYHEPGDAWFYGEQVATLARGEVFLNTLVEVLDIVQQGSATVPLRVGQKVGILERLTCDNCDADRTVGHGYGHIGQRRWYSAAMPPGDAFDAVAGRVLPFDLELDSYCDASVDRQEEGSGSPLTSKLAEWP
jgi:hypothetical protein